MLDRRRFLCATATTFAATLALRTNLLAQLEKAPPLPGHALLDKNEDAYWAEMRKQFLIPADEIYLNNGTVGSSPAPVLRAVFDGYATTEKMDQQDPEDYPIWGYASWNQFRDPVAKFVGCARDECGRGLESVQRRNRPAHPCNVFQPHHNNDWRSFTGQGTLCTGTFQRN